MQKSTDENRTYLAIDLKSFYASVECVDRGLDPLSTNLVVADQSRTEKTICLAVSPSLKAYGIPGRARLFEVVQKVKAVNAERRYRAPGHALTASSHLDADIRGNPSCEVSYIVAPPRMARYMEVSTSVFNVYLRYVAPEDIHSYSVDEVFIDVTGYLGIYGMTARELAMTMIRDVLRETGITATAGIGSNLYLAKIAMDIVAKHVQADSDGVRIAELTERSYRELMWDHRPLTDFWRVGRGYAAKLEAMGLSTMGEIARCSVGRKTEYYNEDLLYKAFGVNAELLIDHAWGWEPCTIGDIKAYRPEEHSLSVGQVLPRPYAHEEGRLIIREMADSLTLDLFEKNLVTDQIVLTVGYDIDNLTSPEIRKRYRGEVTEDRYGRKVPKQAHGSRNLPRYTVSSDLIMEAAAGLYDSIVNPDLLIRRAYVVAAHTIPRGEAEKNVQEYEQLDIFSMLEGKDGGKDPGETEREDKVMKVQEAVLSIRNRYGKNAVLRGFNYLDGATQKQRNGMIGGHQAENGEV